MRSIPSSATRILREVSGKRLFLCSTEFFYSFARSAHKRAISRSPYSFAVRQCHCHVQKLPEGASPLVFVTEATPAPTAGDITASLKSINGARGQPHLPDPAGAADTI